MKCGMKFFFSLFFLFSSFQASADLPPYTLVHPSNFKMIDNAKIESWVQIRAVKSAKKTVSYVTFDSRADEDYGVPFLQALVDAANRGVVVRFIRGGLVSVVYSQVSDRTLTDKVKAMLTQDTAQPINYMLFGGLASLIRGWSFITGIHHKTLIIDGDLDDSPSQVYIFKGRGEGSSYEPVLDSAYVLKGKIVREAQAKFNLLWGTVLKATGTKELPIVQNPIPRPPQEHFRVWLDKNETPLYQQLKSWLGSKALPAVEARKPYLVRTLHNDLLAQLQTRCQFVPWIYNFVTDAGPPSPPTLSWAQYLSIPDWIRDFNWVRDLTTWAQKWTDGVINCTQPIQDPILFEMVRLINKAEKIQFYTLSVTPHISMRNALLRRLKEARAGGRKFELEIFTNSEKSHQYIIPFVSPAWRAGLRDYWLLQQAGAKIWVFQETYKNNLQFLHRKLFLAKMPLNQDEEDSAILSSHNASEGSTVINDEFGVQIQSPELVESLSRQFRQSIDDNGDQIHPDIITEQYKNNFLEFPLLRWVKRFIRATL